MSLDLTPLRSTANEQMLNCRKGSKQWFFWRGVLLAIEAQTSTLVTPEWAKQVSRQKGRGKPL